MPKIVIVYRHFWPDTPPYATMLRDIASGLFKEGHDVEIITAQPSYKYDVEKEKCPWQETIDGIRIRRLWLLPEKKPGFIKLLNSVLFVLKAFMILVFSKKRDVYWTGTMPPVFQSFMISLCARIKRAKYLYHMQDIYPEIAVATPGMSSGPLLKLLGAIDRYTQKRTDMIVVLSDDMKQAIIKRGIAEQKIVVNNNFSLITAEKHTKLASPPKPTEKLKFIFAGNLGRFQNLDALVSAFSHVADDNIELILLGTGRARLDLIKQVEEQSIKNVVFIDHLPPEKAFDLMCTCHVGVVSLTPNLIKYAFPSKVLTYFAANLPVFALVENESALARLLEEKNVGRSVSWQSTPQQVADELLNVAQAVRSEKMQPAELDDLYSVSSAQQRWRTIIATLLNNS